MFEHASVTLYVLVTITGHVPDETSLLVTTKDASVVHASLIANPRLSRAATVETAAGAFDATQPSMVVGAIVPVIVGAVVSSTFITCVADDAFEHSSVIK